MPLFNNWPSVDLSKLNLDWIIMKIKHVEEAEADADKVLEAAETILPKVDQVNSDADRAEAAANAAAASAASAQESDDNCATHELICAQKASSAEASATNAEASAAAAARSATSAASSRDIAEQAVEDCQRSESACRGYASTAEAAAARAESASSTTGYRAYTGTLEASVTKTLELPDGTYLLTWFANDANNSSAIYLLFKNGTSLTYRNVNYIGDGDTGFLINSTETAITIRNQLTVQAYWFVTGCEAF